MTYSPEWDTAYQNGQRKQKGSPHTLTEMFGKYISTLKGERVLELGCGVGGNFEFIDYNGAKYIGVDGSKDAIAEAAAAYPTGTFYVSDFTKMVPIIDEGFDVVFDRAAVSHNDTDGIRAAIKGAWHSLKPGGLYIGVDWFSTKHSEFTRGEVVDDKTRTNYNDGQFVGVGKVHFTDEAELDDFFGGFFHAVVQERTNRRPRPGTFLKGISRQRWISNTYDDDDYVAAVWDLVVRKPE